MSLMNDPGFTDLTRSLLRFPSSISPPLIHCLLPPLARTNPLRFRYGRFFWSYGKIPPLGRGRLIPFPFPCCPPSLPLLVICPICVINLLGPSSFILLLNKLLFTPRTLPPPNVTCPLLLTLSGHCSTLSCETGPPRIVPILLFLYLFFFI